MKKYLLIFLISVSYKYSFSQVVPPQGITYQAVIIDRSIKELPGKDITERYYSNVDMVVKFSILSSQTGPTEYEESQIAKTDAYGLLNLIIGQGTLIGKNFNTIDWSKNEKWLKVEIDFNKKGTFELFSLEKMWSVPYALYSQRSSISDADSSSTNELQNLKISGGGGIISISKGNSIVLGDSSSSNELQSLSQTGTNVTLSKGGGSISVNDGDTTHWKQEGINTAYGEGSVRVKNGKALEIYNVSNSHWASFYMHPAGNYLEENYTLKISNGDIYISNKTKGIILISPNNQCWRVTIDNSGNFVRSLITCP